ncbi:MAG TPA: porin [Polyangiaceae bacterium]|nr:porin [Polyangiaceae bacterium]
MNLMRRRRGWVGAISTGCLASCVSCWLLASPARASEPAPPAARPQVEAALGKGVTIRSKDDLVSLQIRPRVQVRAAFATDPDKTSGSPVIEPEDAATQLAIRRARLAFRGNVLGPKLTYYVQLAFSNADTESDLRLPLRDASMQWEALRDIGLRFGQMKVPLGRQRVISSGALEFPDRSIIIEELSLHRDVGVVAYSRNLLGLGDTLGYQVGVFGGDGRNRVAESAGLLWVARVDLWPNGHFTDLSEGDLERLPKPRLACGLTVAYNQNSYRQQSVVGDTYRLGGYDYLHGSADLMFKWRGLALSGEALLRNADLDSRDGKAADGKPLREWSRSGAGYFAQLSQMLNENIQVATRFSHLQPFRSTDPRLLSRSEAAGSVSYYIAGHALKVQADYSYLFGPGEAGGRHLARLQFQLFL